MGEKSISRPVINSGAQGTRNGPESATQSLLLGLLGLIMDSQLLCVPIAGADKRCSYALTTRLSLKITLLSISRPWHPIRQLEAYTKLSLPTLQASLGGFTTIHHCFATPQYSAIQRIRQGLHDRTGKVSCTVMRFVKSKVR